MDFRQMRFHKFRLHSPKIPVSSFWKSGINFRDRLFTTYSVQLPFSVRHDKESPDTVVENATYARVNDRRNRAFTHAAFPHVAANLVPNYTAAPTKSSRSFCYPNEKDQAFGERERCRWTSR